MTSVPATMTIAAPCVFSETAAIAVPAGALACRARTTRVSACAGDNTETTSNPAATSGSMLDSSPHATTRARLGISWRSRASRRRSVSTPRSSGHAPGRMVSAADTVRREPARPPRTSTPKFGPSSIPVIPLVASLPSLRIRSSTAKPRSDPQASSYRPAPCLRRCRATGGA